MAKAPETDRKSFVDKILPATHCRPRVFSRFSPNSMISIDQGGGGYPPRAPNSHFGKPQSCSRFSSPPSYSRQQPPSPRRNAALSSTKKPSVSPPAPTPPNSAKLAADTNWSSSKPAATGPTSKLSSVNRKKTPTKTIPNPKARTITGWVASKALVNLTTPNGDKIVFGEAADSEDQASRRRGTAATPPRTPCVSTSASTIYFPLRRSPPRPCSPRCRHPLAGRPPDVLTRPSARERDLGTCAAKSTRHG